MKRHFKNLCKRFINSIINVILDKSVQNLGSSMYLKKITKIKKKIRMHNYNQGGKGA